MNYFHCGQINWLIFQARRFQSCLFFDSLITRSPYLARLHVSVCQLPRDQIRKPLVPMGFVQNISTYNVHGDVNIQHSRSVATAVKVPDLPGAAPPDAFSLVSSQNAEIRLKYLEKQCFYQRATRHVLKKLDSISSISIQCIWVNFNQAFYPKVFLMILIKSPIRVILSSTPSCLHESFFIYTGWQSECNNSDLLHKTQSQSAYLTN